MINRLIQFYKRSKQGVDSSLHEVWNGITTQYQKPLIDVLDRGDASELKAMLDTIGTTDILWGLQEPGVVRFDDPRSLSSTIHLAKRCGVLPLCNPEQPCVDSGEYIFQNIRTAIEIETGFKLHYPDLLGYKCESGAGLPLRFQNSVAAAYSIMLMTDAHPPTRMLEIGTGIGIMPLLCHRWGVKTYSVIDLPVVAVIAAYGLSKVCGERDVWLEGEEWKPEAYARFYPSTNFKGAGMHQYDVAFNSDSLPEIPYAQQEEYLQLIATTLSVNGFFLSINHESTAHGQRSVRTAAEETKVLSLKSRAPFMMREGYCEEIYTI